MAFFDEERYKNSSEPEWDIMIVLRSTQPSTNRHKRILKRDFNGHKSLEIVQLCVVSVSVIIQTTDLCDSGRYF